MVSPEPSLDLTKIDFPSERLDLKKMRHSFLRISHPATRNEIVNEVGQKWFALAISEGRIAQMAFAEALGQSLGEESPNEREMRRKEVTLAYVDLQLATGEQYAQQLVRDLESAAAKQAKAFGLNL
jgi:hypothetical protein